MLQACDGATAIVHHCSIITPLQLHYGFSITCSNTRCTLGSASTHIWSRTPCTRSVMQTLTRIIQYMDVKWVCNAISCCQKVLLVILFLYVFCLTTFTFIRLFNLQCIIYVSMWDGWETGIMEERRKCFIFSRIGFGRGQLYCVTVMCVYMCV